MLKNCFFHISGYNAVKLQLTFHIIWESPSDEEKDNFLKISILFFLFTSFSYYSLDSLEYLLTILNKRGYYGQEIYNVNIDKNPLITITYKSVCKIKDFIMYMLKDLQMKNSDNGESNHRVIGVYKFQVFLYNVSKNTCGKIGEKGLISSFIYNEYAYLIS
jgi:hypothetical protein